MVDKVVCFHTLLKVLILLRVTEVFSISADSKALAEMERAVSPFLVSLMDQRGFSLYTLNYYTMLFIFVKGKLVLEPHLWGGWHTLRTLVKGGCRTLWVWFRKGADFVVSGCCLAWSWETYT